MGGDKHRLVVLPIGFVATEAQITEHVVHNDHGISYW